MKTRKRILSFSLALLILFSAVSCKKDGDGDESGGAVENNSVDSSYSAESTKISLLTGVYSGEKLTLPDGYSVLNDVLPYSADGVLKLLMRRYEDSFDESGERTGTRNYCMVRTYDSDMNELDSMEFELTDEDGNSVLFNSGILTEEYLYYLVSNWSPTSQEYYLCKYSFADGAVVKSDELSALFSPSETGWFSISYMAEANGEMYLASESEIIVLNSDFVRQYSVPVPSWVNSMASSPDGRVYVGSYFENGSGVAPIDAEAKSLGDVIYLDGGVQSICFGEGYDMYTVSSDGISGVNLADNSSELIFNYLNSSVISSYFEVLTAIDSETFLVDERDPVTLDSSLTVYKKSADIDLSDIRTVEIAVGEYLSGQLTQSVITYNKAHKDTRIVIKDFTDEGGVDKLALDIANGLYKPDIVIGSSYSDSNKAAQYLVDNGLFTDLNEIMLADSGYDSSDIFDCVKRTFTTDDGRMWGITNEFSVGTLVGSRESLGERTGWTLGEMLDYALSLPDGTTLFDGATKTSMLGNNAFDYFFTPFINTDKHTCSFEDETFYKLLEFIKSLPDEPSQTSRDNRYESFHNGSAMIYTGGFREPKDWLALELVFNTKDYTLIGYPTVNEGECGGLLEYSSSYLITSFCENTDIAWDFLKSILTPEYSEMRGRYMELNKIPVYKSVFDKVCEIELENEYALYYSGSASWGTKGDTPRTLREPGILTYFTEEDAAAMKSYINDCAGRPAGEQIPDEVMSIIKEEITSYTAGAKTAEDCARVIQSRVSIWLSEHE